MQDLFTKKDWTLFRKKIPGWQEAYMDRLNREYIELLSSDEAASEKFWKLDKRIKTDKRSPGVQIQLRRSNLIYDLAALVGGGVIRREELDDFSEGLQEAVDVFLNVSGWNAE